MNSQSLLVRIWTAWRSALAETRVRKSIRGDDALLAFVAADKPFLGHQLPESTDFLCPELAVHSSGYDRYVSSVGAELIISFVCGNECHVLHQSQVTLTPTPLEFGGLSIPWRGTPLAARSGEARLVVRVADVIVADFPLSCVPAKEVIGRTTVRDLKLNATLKEGRVAARPRRIALRDITSIAPSFIIQTPVFAPNTVLRGRLIISQSENVLAGVAFETALVAKEISLKTAQASCPVGIEGNGNKPLRLKVEIEGKELAHHEIRVIAARPITTFDGSLREEFGGVTETAAHRNGNH